MVKVQIRGLELYKKKGALNYFLKYFAKDSKMFNALIKVSSLVIFGYILLPAGIMMLTTYTSTHHSMWGYSRTWILAIVYYMTYGCRGSRSLTLRVLQDFCRYFWPFWFISFGQQKWYHMEANKRYVNDNSSVVSGVFADGLALLGVIASASIVIADVGIIFIYILW